MLVISHRWHPSLAFKQTLTLPKVTTCKVTDKMPSHLSSDEVITLLKDKKKKKEEEEAAKAQRKAEREAKKLLHEQEKAEKVARCRRKTRGKEERQAVVVAVIQKVKGLDVQREEGEGEEEEEVEVVQEKKSLGVIKRLIVSAIQNAQCASSVSLMMKTTQTGCCVTILNVLLGIMLIV